MRGRRVWFESARVRRVELAERELGVGGRAREEVEGELGEDVRSGGSAGGDVTNGLEV